MSSYLSRECPAENARGTDQSSFFDGRWDAHEKGWVIAGATAFVVSHGLSWTVRVEQVAEAHRGNLLWILLRRHS